MGQVWAACGSQYFLLDQVRDRMSFIATIRAIEAMSMKWPQAHAIEPLWEAGNVFLPEPDKAPSIHDFIEELVNFGSSLHDDQVDAMSQALMRLSERSARRSRPLKLRCATREICWGLPAEASA